MTDLILLLACHFIGDYPFQSEYFVLNKGKSWEVNFYHAATYTSVFVIFAHTSLVATLLLLISHFIIDPLKARYKIVPTIWADQLLHLMIILIIFYFHL